MVYTPTAPRKVVKQPKVATKASKTKAPQRAAPVVRTISLQKREESKRIAREAIAAARGSADIVTRAHRIAQEWLDNNRIEEVEDRLQDILQSGTALAFNLSFLRLITDIEQAKKDATVVKQTPGMLGSHKQDIDNRLGGFDMCIGQQKMQLLEKCRTLGIGI